MKDVILDCSLVLFMYVLQVHCVIIHLNVTCNTAEAHS